MLKKYKVCAHPEHEFHILLRLSTKCHKLPRGRETRCIIRPSLSEDAKLGYTSRAIASCKSQSDRGTNREKSLVFYFIDVPECHGNIINVPLLFFVFANIKSKALNGLRIN